MRPPLSGVTGRNETSSEPVVTATFGGSNVGAGLSGIASSIQGTAAAISTAAQVVGLEAGYQRRDEDWQFQVEQADKDIARIKVDIDTAKSRIDIARRELDRHVQQVKNADQVSDFLTSKYTNEDLFSWMSRELSRVFYQTYLVAFDVAKRAQRCYQLELADDTTRHVKFGAWNDGRKGLLSGDILMGQIRRLEADYYEFNAREYELTKRISLNEIDPGALIKLRAEGECYIDVPEVLYDLDYPGHFMRRIKTVSLSMPCVTGSYANVNATLSLVRSEVRVTASDKSQALEPDVKVDLVGGVRSIATSSGEEDSGMFQTNLNDARYLPFETKGAVSSWRVQLPQCFRSFDYETIADVVLTVRYTARDGGQAYAAQTETGTIAGNLAATRPNETATDAPKPAWIRAWPQPNQLLMRGVSLKTAFPNAWRQFKAEVEPSKVLQLARVHERLGLGRVADDQVALFCAVVCGEDGFPNGKIVHIADNSNVLDPSSGPYVQNLPMSMPDNVAVGPYSSLTSQPGTPQLQPVTIALDSDTTWWVGLPDLSSQDIENIEDIVLVVHYAPADQSA